MTFHSTLFSVLAFFSILPAGVADDISINAGAIKPLPAATVMASANGVDREQLYRDDTLQVYRDSCVVDGRTQMVLIAENCLNTVGALESVSYRITIGGVVYGADNHYRFQRAWWVMTPETIVLNKLDVLDANTLQWGPDWLTCKPLTVGKIGKSGSTGANVIHGCWPGYCGSFQGEKIAVYHGGVVQSAWPIHVRDPQTLDFIRDVKFNMGPTIWKAAGGKSKAPSLDTAHSGNLAEPMYKAAKGTVLERLAAEEMEAAAIFACCCDFPGDLWRKQIRGVGRSLRHVVAFIETFPDHPTSKWLRPIVDKCCAYYRGDGDRPAWVKADGTPLVIPQHLAVFNVANGLRKAGEGSPNWSIAPWEWTYLVYAIDRAERNGFDFGALPNNALQFFSRLGGVHSMVQIGDPAGNLFPLDEILKIDADQAKAAGGYGNSYRGEYYVLRRLMAKRWSQSIEGLGPLTSVLDTTGNDAGFRLPMPVSRFAVTIDETPAVDFPNTQEAIDDALARANRRLLGLSEKQSVGVKVWIEPRVTWRD